MEVVDDSPSPTVSSAAMQSPPLDHRTLSVLVRAAESPVAARTILRVMYAESGIVEMLAMALEPGERAALDERPIGPGDLTP